MRITKVTTRTGDDGQTSLATGERVSKASLRVAACGEVDELNSLLGLVRQKVSAGASAASSTEQDTRTLDSLLQQIQNHLFILGADLSTPIVTRKDDSAAPVSIRRISTAEVEQLDQALDRFNEMLPPLQEFILPGGSETGALLHLARTVARRAERSAVALSAAERVNPQALIYLNRLSDLLFVLARHVNRLAGEPESSADFH